MDFNKYYLDQANGFPVFRGVQFQIGNGLGNVFRRFMSWAIPYFKEYALPVAKNIGKEIISSAASVANDAIEGKDIKESAKEKLKTSFDKLTQRGKGIKRKRNKIKKTRKLDIFD